MALDNIKTYIKSHKFFVLALFLIVVIGIGSVIALSFYQKKADQNSVNTPEKQDAESSLTVSTEPLAATVIITNEYVQVMVKDSTEWKDAAIDQLLNAGDKIKTGNTGSSAVIQFPGGDFLVVGSTSEVEIVENTASRIIIGQQYGTTYHQVVPRDNFFYSVTKEEAKITALGTEFMVEMSGEMNLVSVSVMKNKVRYQYQNNQMEIEEMHKATYDNVNNRFEDNNIENSDEAKQPYIALIDKANEVINQKKLAVEEAARKAAEETSEEAVAKKAAKEIAIQQTAGSSSTSNNVQSSNTSVSTDSSIATSGSQTATTENTIGSITDQSSSQSSAPAVVSTDETPAKTIFGSFSTTSVESIVNSLSLVLNDAIGDWSEPGGGGPPEGIYHYDPIDLDNLYMGIRDGRLYIKWSLSGTIPDLIQTIDGDTIVSVTYNIGIDNDGDSGDSCGGSETHLQINIQYHDNGQIWYNPWFNAGCLSGEGEHDAVYEANGSGLAHTYNSGLGKTTIVYSYALSDLANTISVGSNLKLDISSEAESKAWHHYSYDQNRILEQRTWVDWTAAEI